MTKMTTGVMLSLIAVASCGGGGGGGGDNNSTPSGTYTIVPSGQLFGLEGVQYSSQAAATDENTVENAPASGTTGSSGQFYFGYSVEKVCAAVKNDDGSYKEVCSDKTPVTSPATFSICGKNVGPVDYWQDRQGATAVFTNWDLFPDQQSIDNFTAVALMADTNSGDPLSMGIKNGLPASGCQTDWPWSTGDIQHDAASFQAAVAQTDGLTHPWPSLQAVRDYETASYRCARSGLYTAIRDNYAKMTNVNGLFWGSLFVLADLQGHISGAFDFSVQQPQPLYPGVVTFSTDYSVSPGGAGSFTYSTSATDPIPNLLISGKMSPLGMTLEYHTADGSLASDLEGLMQPWRDAFVTKYRFVAANLQYPARTGVPLTTETLVLTLDIGYDNKASGTLFDFPSLLPWSVNAEPGGLEVVGTLKGNTLTLHYVNDWFSAASKAGSFTLTLDPNTTALTGPFPTYDGKSFVTFASDHPLQGCGHSPPHL